jgi:hypothetical protein
MTDYVSRNADNDTGCVASNCHAMSQHTITY